MRWRTEWFEPNQQVGYREDDLEEHLVGCEVLGRNLPQRTGVFQLAANQSRAGARTLSHLSHLSNRRRGVVEGRAVP